MALSSSDEFPNEGEDLSKGSSFNGVTGLRAREGKSRRLGERISGMLFLGSFGLVFLGCDWCIGDAGGGCT